MNLPDFLQPAVTLSENQGLPDFLIPHANPSPSTRPSPIAPSTTANKELVELQNENLFETVLEKISSGIPLMEALRDDVRQPDAGAFLRWLHRDPKRKQRYYEAQAIGGEIIASEMISIADAKISLEDVQRSTLRINTRKFLLSVWDKKRFGETKQIEINQSISITDALAAANSRMANIIEGEIIEDIQSPTRALQHDNIAAHEDGYE